MRPQNQRNMFSSSIFLVSLLVTFIVFVEKLELHRLVGFDVRIIGRVQANIDRVHTRWMKLFTFLGSPASVSTLVAFASLVLYRRGRHRQALGMILVNAAGVGFNEGLKYIFRRRRPDIHRVVIAHGYSFPSGHAMGSLMFYGTLSYFICRQTTSLVVKLGACIASAWMVSMTGLSRIYLGVHFPSDVFAGYAVGGTCLSASIKALNSFLPRGKF